MKTENSFLSEHETAIDTYFDEVYDLLIETLFSFATRRQSGR